MPPAGKNTACEDREAIRVRILGRMPSTSSLFPLAREYGHSRPIGFTRGVTPSDQLLKEHGAVRNSMFDSEKSCENDIENGIENAREYSQNTPRIRRLVPEYKQNTRPSEGNQGPKGRRKLFFREYPRIHTEYPAPPSGS